MSGMFPVASFPCICYRTEDYHCVSVSYLFGLPLSWRISVYEWPHLSVALTVPESRTYAVVELKEPIRIGSPSGLGFVGQVFQHRWVQLQARKMSVWSCSVSMISEP